MPAFNIRTGVALAVLAVTTPGCTHFPFMRYGPDRQTHDEFERRVEAAFRLQNNMTSEAMIMQESKRANENQETIAKAEQRMQQACHYLNEYAAKEMDGEGAGFLLLSRVEKSVAECEQAAHRLESLIQTYQGL
jgi:sugar phosphate isomerase/epimerase